ncbi:D-glycero-beta-D-manno-heptose 1-phosphate adenylyltransferase [Gloeocapsopsis sp. IPPAS B-1203]|uniref:D-glycero-beta-D-manno-heptose 1-phosphate adenylyltransferase n=1 Tax=Gloeocapsopsis sp. IPPAS B-1203 TaxID=2049454 RepID=UPI000C1876DE|nr:D-glycero-beta-D-manno-heptose 1-phosphate adenylyltransferase [Gloeocapsopsis sp. IPPAS B-1203]PIG94227.1 D-glycero-beta-D-manno-heptose 1-phosphate adenylyltransferase [Gloeocapsopsis sp. IPPAS B-1203]
MVNDLLDAIAGLRVLVIGEAMLDCYLHGASDRLCPEAPVPVVNVTHIDRAPGGAANTAVNARCLGADVMLLSVVGDDWEGTLLQQALAERGVSSDNIYTQLDRRSLSKQRVVASSQILVRFDQGSTTPISTEIEQKLIVQIHQLFPQCDAVIVSDYGYGILTPRVIEAIAKLQQVTPRILVVDSKHLATYKNIGVTAVKPNYAEALKLLDLETTANDTRVNQILPHGQRLLDITGAEIVAVTLDAEGAIVFERSTANGIKLHRTCTKKATNHATGAGDTFVSALALALAAKVSTKDAAEFAAAAAAVVVQKDGTTACTAQDLREAQVAPTEKYISDRTQLMKVLAAHRAAGRRIVFTNGCFDILHAGHVSYLNQARTLGDILVIGVNSDASVSRIKGSTRPINSLFDRIQVLAGLGCVDYLVSFDEDTPLHLLPSVRPNIYVKGGDYTKATLPETPLVEQLGGEVHLLPFVENCSTTSIIQRCQSLHKEAS